MSLPLANCVCLALPLRVPSIRQPHRPALVKGQIAAAQAEHARAVEHVVQLQGRVCGGENDRSFFLWWQAFEAGGLLHRLDKRPRGRDIDLQQLVYRRQRLIRRIQPGMEGGAERAGILQRDLHPLNEHLLDFLHASLQHRLDHLRRPVGILQGKPGHHLVVATGILRHKAELVGYGRGQRVQFRPVLDGCHDVLQWDSSC